MFLQEHLCLLLIEIVLELEDETYRVE